MDTVLIRYRPVLGSFVTVRKSWHWTQWTIIFFAIFSFILLLLPRETYKKTIIQRRNKKLGIPPPPSPFPNASARLKFMLTVTLFRPIHMLITEPIVGFLSLYVAFNWAILYGFFAAYPFVFESVYHFNIEESGLVFLGIAVGCLIAFVTCWICDWYFYQPQVRMSHAKGRKGVVAPEHRLYPAMMGSFALPTSLFWFAWTAREDVSWVSPVVSSVLFSWGNLCIFSCEFPPLMIPSSNKFVGQLESD
jgi:Major Facilitator Superfamily